MKGISTVIATILMLMITIALAGTAYLYISGAFTQQTQGLELIDVFCTGGNAVTLSVRNLGTDSISANTIRCLQTAPSGELAGACTSTPATLTHAAIPPGTTLELTDTCGGAGPRSCVYRLTPSSGRGIVGTTSCT